MDYDAWNDMSSEYDNNVELNSDPIVSGFISEEIKITSNLCRKIITSDRKHTIIDMGSGTGRVLFALSSVLGNSISYCGLDASLPMIQLSQKKQSKMKNSHVSFVHHDVTDPAIDKLFDDDSVKIVMCMYNTVGVIPVKKRQQFFDSMIRLAGRDGLVLISAFNGDDFAYAAPKIYTPMKKMVKQIDENSFDEDKLAFRNKLGYYSKWFTKDQLQQLLHSNEEPIPIKISLNDETRTFGHIFSNRSV